MRLRPAAFGLLLPLLGLAGPGPKPPAGPGLRIAVSLPKAQSPAPLDGRLLLLISTDSTAEPRNQISDGPETQLIFGTDVNGWAPGTDAWVDGKAFGSPMRSLDQLPAGRYWVQALLNRYETYHRSDGFTIKVPPDKGEGQHWNIKPGNLYSTPRWVQLDGRLRPINRLVLDREIPPIPVPADTRYIKHIRIQSKLLTAFWGKPVFLGAHVLLPEGFDQHPEAHYPLVINHGHFPDDIAGFRTEPPDPNLKPDYSARFRLPGYNRIQEQQGYQFYKDWTAPGFPRVLEVEIQHPTPYYDDSYAVNSANNGPYGDAIMQELVPEIERRFRGIGQGYARFTYGGSTGGWEALAVQMFYPDDFNGAWVACPDPIDFRAYTVVNIYEDKNAYFLDSQWKHTPRAGLRDYLGRPQNTLQETNFGELAVATNGRSGGQWDIWQAVFSPVGEAGYPKPIWDKLTGQIDRSVAGYWKEHFDLSYILKRDWKTLGPKVKGKLHIYVGEADNYYLNNAVYLMEDFLKSATDPAADAEVDYGARAEHCWNGDHTQPNAISRLRYPQMFIPRIMDQIRKNHPAGVDTLSWRY